MTFALAGALVATTITGFRIESAPPLDAVANPLLKTVDAGKGLWLANYARFPWMIVAPALGFAGGIVAFAVSCSRLEKPPSSRRAR